MNGFKDDLDWENLLEVEGPRPTTNLAANFKRSKVPGTLCPICLEPKAVCWKTEGAEDLATPGSPQADNVHTLSIDTAALERN